MAKLCKLYADIINILEKLNWLPLLLARISMGSIFLVSGWGKLQNLPRVIGVFTDLGIPFPEYLTPFVSGVELVCGGLILLGLLTRFASIPLIITMIVAIVTAQLENIHGISDFLGLDEFVYIVFFIWFVIDGAGKISIDYLISQKCRRD